MKILQSLFIIVLIFASFIIFDYFSKKNNPKDIVVALNQELIQQSLSLEGKIPTWLKGTFVRNGPIPVHNKNQTIAHWFDGPAMLHDFSFNAGNIVYSNKFLITDAYKKVFIEGNLNYSGFASESNDPYWNKIKAFFSRNKSPIIQNANVNISKIANQTVALTETPLPVIFDLNTLETIGALSFKDILPKSNIFESAHPQNDKNAHEQINYLVKYGQKSKYVIYRYNPNIARREVISEINVDRPSYMHSFAITEQYVILVEFPLVVNPIDLMLSNKGFITSFHWRPELGTNFIIINRKTGLHVKTINDKTPIFAFHHVNAFEKGDDIILDIVTYPNPNVITDLASFDEKNEPANPKGTTPNVNKDLTKLTRYTLSLKTPTIQSTVLVDSPIEFPRINENYNAVPYRYAYAVDARPLAQTTDLRPIYKIDVTTKEKLIWQEPGLTPGEPVFIQNPEANKDEDSGVVITIVLDTPKQKAFLLILDAKTFKEIGRSYAPHSIPVGLHGQFFTR